MDFDASFGVDFVLDFDIDFGVALDAVFGVHSMLAGLTTARNLGSFHKQTCKRPFLRCRDHSSPQTNRHSIEQFQKYHLVTSVHLSAIPAMMTRD